MTQKSHNTPIEEAIEAFQFEGKYLDCQIHGSGHINDTFLVRFKNPNQQIISYILQRMNHHVFKNPQQLMENVVNVTTFLQKKIAQSGGDPCRETMNIIQTKDGQNYYKDSSGSYWRSYQYIDDVISLNKVEHPEEFYESAVAFGRFQHLLCDYPAHTLHETIRDFHNTPDRFQKLIAAIDADPCNRAKEVKQEIEFVLNRESFTHTLMDAMENGTLPLRVTHNDTKLNNVLLDPNTKKAVCVIDLDTVMPGFSVNDFGDSIRFGASTGEEDEPDLSKVHFDLTLYEYFTKGFLLGCNGSLSNTELDLLPAGAKMMTLECGMRFLTDYLEGDTYFKTSREKHNLDRCRTQFQLVREMEHNWDKMHHIISKYR